MSESKPYLKIVSHYEQCLNQHGDTHLGVDWASAEDAGKRYRVMLDLLGGTADCRLLDFGCGTAHLLDYIIRNGLGHIEYTGLDISADFVDLCRVKYPQAAFLQLDVLDPQAALPEFDYVVMNGVFTEKGDLGFEQMFDYFASMIRRIYPMCRRGMAFNVRSPLVEKQEDDLFHLPFERVAGFLSDQVSRHFTCRHDYGLEEYTVYVYRNPSE